MIYLTSDLLFGRQKAAEDRGFDDLDRMEAALVDQWNATVKDADTVYHLGNFSWDPISAETVLASLRGKIVFLLGPRDAHMSEVSLVRAGRHQVVAGGGMSLLRDIPVKRKKGRTDVVISHWPLADWPGRESGVIHAHGGSVSTDLSSQPGRFCVNCSYWELKPVDVEALLEFADEFSDGARARI